MSQYDDATQVFSSGGASTRWTNLDTEASALLASDSLSAPQALRWLQAASALCREHWTQFDVAGMVLACVVLGCATIIAVVMGLGWCPHQRARAVRVTDPSTTGGGGGGSVEGGMAMMGNQWRFLTLSVSLLGGSTWSRLLHGVITATAAVGAWLWCAQAPSSPSAAVGQGGVTDRAMAHTFAWCALISMAAFVLYSMWVARSLAQSSRPARHRHRSGAPTVATWVWSHAVRVWSRVSLAPTVAALVVLVRMATMFSNSYMAAESSFVTVAVGTVLAAVTVQTLRSQLMMESNTTLVGFLRSGAPVLLMFIVSAGANRVVAWYGVLHSREFGKAMSAGTYTRARGARGAVPFVPFVGLCVCLRASYLG